MVQDVPALRASTQLEKCGWGSGWKKVASGRCRTLGFCQPGEMGLLRMIWNRVASKSGRWWGPPRVSLIGKMLYWWVKLINGSWTDRTENEVRCWEVKLLSHEQDFPSMSLMALLFGKALLTGGLFVLVFGVLARAGFLLVLVTLWGFQRKEILCFHFLFSP